MPKAPRLQLNAEFPDLIAQAGLSQRAFARQAGVSFSTIMGLLHPELHPGRRGGMQLRTAWLIAHTYAKIVGIEPAVAFRVLIHPEHGPKIHAETSSGDENDTVIAN